MDNEGKMTATSLIRWLLGHAAPGHVAWATGAPAHRQLAALNGARRASIAAVQSGVDAAEAGEEKEWEPGVWARAAIGIYS
jgi:hypothetical protein